MNPFDVTMPRNLKLHATLWPTFPHFQRFAEDPRLTGIRLNSAMMSSPDLDRELETIRATHPRVPLYFDVKGRQLRVAEVLDNPEYLDVRLNHPIRCSTPSTVLFKAGADRARLGTISEGGFRLTFSHNPEYRVRAGESLHIRDSGLEVLGSLFTEAEREKVAKVRASGLVQRWYLSYVEKASDLAEFRELVGRDAEILLKIESLPGLEYAGRYFRKEEGVRLVAACGDLYVEVRRPHDILQALRMIAGRDPEAVAGSRMMLSVVREPIPSLADFAQIAWLRDIGFSDFLLCDEICLKEDTLGVAVSAFEAFRRDYHPDE